MPKYFFSRYNELVTVREGNFYRNSITGYSVPYRADFRTFLLEEIFETDLTALSNSFIGKVKQLITAELLYRGIIIPVNYNHCVLLEVEYLSSLLKIKHESTGTFFSSKKITESDLNGIKFDNKNIIFCGIPYDTGAKRPGARFAPSILRKKSNSRIFRSKTIPCILNVVKKSNIFENLNTYDIGDINLDSLGLNSSLDRVEFVSSSIAKLGVPAFIGGDHLFTYPLLKGIAKSNKNKLLFVHFDYHLDTQLWGEFVDNRPRILSKPTHANFVSWISHEIPNIEILQIGIDQYQSVGEENFFSVSKYITSISKVLSNSCLYCNQDIKNNLPKDRSVYISIDVDVLNIKHISNTGYPSSTGIDIFKMIELLDNICSNNEILGFDIMEFGKNDKEEMHNIESDIICNLVLKILDIIGSK